MAEAWAAQQAQPEFAEHQNVIISGKPGTGKTYIACALVQQACRKSYRAIYRRAPRLSQELALARADGSTHQARAPHRRADHSLHGVPLCQRPE